MPQISDLRSPYDQVSGIVYFGRMLDKIRLHARGELPAEYSSFIGEEPGGFDSRCVKFLNMEYKAITQRTLQGGSDEEILAWTFENGRKPSDEEIEVWNGFMQKRGWRDAAHDRLIFRINESGFPPDCGIQTMFDYIDADEGRPLKVFP